ncbi:hypothetical protein DACRYDRAFT_49685, partial [Dacryopinax primogenitus]
NWTVIRVQLPLQLVYATTFHSCQGLTLDRTVLDCCSDVFAHGRLYTALTHVCMHLDTRSLVSDSWEGTVANIQNCQLLLP